MGFLNFAAGTYIAEQAVVSRSRRKSEEKAARGAARHAEDLHKQHRELITELMTALYAMVTAWEAEMPAEYRARRDAAVEAGSPLPDFYAVPGHAGNRYWDGLAWTPIIDEHSVMFTAADIASLGR